VRRLQRQLRANPHRLKKKLSRLQHAVAYTSACGRTFYFQKNPKTEKVDSKRGKYAPLLQGRDPFKRVFRPIISTLREISQRSTEMSSSYIRKSMTLLKPLQAEYFQFGFQPVFQYLLKTLYQTLHFRDWVAKTSLPSLTESRFDA